jgi:hypothetical protein
VLRSAFQVATYGRETRVRFPVGRANEISVPPAWSAGGLWLPSGLSYRKERGFNRMGHAGVWRASDHRWSRSIWSTPSLREPALSATDEWRSCRRCSGRACNCRCAPPWVRLIPGRHRASGSAFSQSRQATGMAFPTVSWRHTELLGAGVAAPGPGAWGRPSFSARPLPVRRVDDAYNPLGSRIDMNVLDLHRLVIAPTMAIKGVE